jgi:hypothetical protein
MKGIIFNVLEEVVTEMFDADTWDGLLEHAELDGTYTALGNYGDHELEGIVTAGCSATGHERDDLLLILGRRMLPKLCDRVPESVTQAADPFTFIENVNMIIHPEVLKLYPGAAPPAFECERTSDGLLVRYSSRRDLSALAEGLLSGVGDRFDVPMTVTAVDGEPGVFLVAIGT